MNYIKHLAGFFDRIALDHRLNPSHVSMYVSIFRFWNANRFENPISISRSEIMAVSKISSKGTYHKCIKELHDYGYLKYVPSYNPFKGSIVYLFDFQSDAEQAPAHSTTNFYPGPRQVVTRHYIKKEEGAGQALGPSINTIKHYKQVNPLKNRGADFEQVQKEGQLDGSEKVDRREIPTSFGKIGSAQKSTEGRSRLHSGLSEEKSRPDSGDKGEQTEIPTAFGTSSTAPLLNSSTKDYGEPL